jgi:hypothetical protein
MAKLSDLVSVLAAHEVDAFGTLNLFSRRLREAGRVSKAKRGRGAASMSYLDAARFLIAVGATDHPERAIEVEQFFSNALPFCMPSRVEGLPPVLADIFDLDLPFDQAVAMLVERCGDIPIPLTPKTYLEIERASGGGSITIGDGVLWFVQPKTRALYTGDSLPADPAELDRLNDEALVESGKFATGKSIRATFFLGLIMALRKSIAGPVDE